MKHITFILFAAFIAISSTMLSMGCPPSPSPPPGPDATDAALVEDTGAPAPDPVPPVTTDATAGFSCGTWCGTARALGCPAGQPTPAGASCEAVCENTLDGPVPFDLGCRTYASSCAAADQCEIGLGAAPATCATWCKHAAVLKCPAAAPTKLDGGSTCVAVCTNVQSGPAKFNLKCRTAAKTCAAADRCEH